MKKLIYSICIVLIASSTFAQDLTDALRYSNYHINGTARSAAMGNAFGALGGDFTSLSINPAGAAVYRTGEFTFTPSVDNTSVDGTVLGNKANDSKYNMSINNIGYVTNIPTGASSESGLVSLSFGLGFNRLGSFSMNSLAEGINPNHSLLENFTNNANNPFTPGADLDPYYEQLAWKTDLMYDLGNSVYQNDITNAGYHELQTKTTQQSGYINEYVLSFAANFNHKLYVGATIGIHDVKFKENADLFESDPNNTIPNFNSFNFNTYLKTTGSGYNVKFGVIYKPTENLRLGLALHSPTFYKFHDLYNNTMNSSLTYVSDGVSQNYSENSGDGVYDYEIQTPLKTILSGAYVIGKSGLISVDYEIIDYSTAKLKNGSNGYNYVIENMAIQNAYRTVGNLHLGGEYRVNNTFSLRAGYENFPSVYKSTYQSAANANSNTSYSTISGGFGFKEGNFFLDAAVKHMMNDQYLKLYPGAVDIAKYNTNQNSVICTLGFKF